VAATDPTFRVVDGRCFTESEEKQILTLVGRAFKNGPFWFRLSVPPVDYLRWKMRDMPWGTTALLMEIGPRLIGFSLSMHRRLLVQEVEREVREGGDLSIDPEFQGRGLYRLMHRYQDQHVEPRFDFVFSYQGHPVSLHVSPDRGRREFGNPVRVLWKPLDIRRLAGGRPVYRRGGGVRLYIRELLFGVRRGLRVMAPTPSWSISTVRRFAAPIDAFCEAASKPFSLIHRRTAAGLNWRYCDPRGGAFIVRLAEDGRQELGYTVLTVRGGVGHIADILALPGRLDVVRSLIGDALRILKGAGAASAQCRMVAIHPYNEAFRLFGFLTTAERIGAVYAPRRLSAAALSFLDDPHAAMHVTTGDSDNI
jgi:hypothetical protein